MSDFHVLNGDCLAEKIPSDLAGEKIIWRETLVLGPTLEEDFFKNREQFIIKNYGGNSVDYSEKVLREYEKFQKIPANSNLYFWFEYDLFCQVNFWFLLSKIKQENIELFIVYPITKKGNDKWKGFGNLNSDDLKTSFLNAKKIDNQDKFLAKKLWETFSIKDFEELKLLSKSNSNIFQELPKLIEIIENRFNGTLKKQISELKNEGDDFLQLFKRFTEKFGIYGFGDLQFQLLLNEFELN